MFSSKWCILCRFVRCNDDGGGRQQEDCFEVYKMRRQESISGVLNRVGHARGDVLLCYEYMDKVLESLYKDKNCFTERWVVFFLLRFLVSYASLRDNPGHYYPFSSFEELCIRMVVWRVLNTIDESLSESDENNICDKAIEKRNNRVIRERHLPSPFVIDVTRTLCDAKALAHTAIKNKTK